jgi:hypothetical protein
LIDNQNSESRAELLPSSRFRDNTGRRKPAVSCQCKRSAAFRVIPAAAIYPVKGRHGAVMNCDPLKSAKWRNERVPRAFVAKKTTALIVKQKTRSFNGKAALFGSLTAAPPRR